MRIALHRIARLNEYLENQKVTCHDHDNSHPDDMNNPRHLQLYDPDIPSNAMSAMNKARPLIISKQLTQGSRPWITSIDKGRSAELQGRGVEL